VSRDPVRGTGPVKDGRCPPVRQPPRPQREVRIHGLADQRVEEVEPRQHDLVYLLAAGYTNRQIARRAAAATRAFPDRTT
jgi:hypothetical protein